jgi:hypothetical protein
MFSHILLCLRTEVLRHTGVYVSACLLKAGLSAAGRHEGFMLFSEFASITYYSNQQGLPDFQNHYLPSHLNVHLLLPPNHILFVADHGSCNRMIK